MKYLLIFICLLFIYLLICYIMFIFIFKANKNGSFKVIDNNIDKLLLPYKNVMNEALKWFNSVNKESMSIKSFDGIKLNGIFINNKKSKYILILCHGYRSTKERDLYASLKHYYNMGLSILLLDQRACLNQEGKYITFGYNESKDVNLWINYIYKKYKKEVILGGVSLGASTILMVNNKHVVSIIADSAYSSAYEEIKYAISHYFHIIPSLFIGVISLYFRVFTGINLKEVSTYKNLDKINIPILFIHGSIDDFVPLKNVYDNYDYYKGEKDILVIDGAAHGMGYLIDSNKYINKINEFLNKYLNL